MTCSRPLSGYVSGQIIQKRGNAEVGAFFGTEVLCNGSSQWTSIATRPRAIRGSSPRTAVLTRARAFVSGRVWMWDESTGEVFEGEASNALRIR